MNVQRYIRWFSLNLGALARAAKVVLKTERHMAGESPSARTPRHELRPPAPAPRRKHHPAAPRLDADGEAPRDAV
jgi:hypothetical protein